MSMPSFFAQPPLPQTKLGRHRPLSPAAAVKVSPLCLGTMNFGDSWKDFMGECTKEQAFEILDYFFAHGGNFIDTASNYQCEESEQWLGEWMSLRGNRDQIVLATKYTHGYKSYDKSLMQTNYIGNNAKSMHVSVKDSLRKLRTDYIDILYLHWWDFTTSIEEIMQGLNQLVVAGKVIYLGVSDTPAWIVSSANRYARDHGLRPFTIYQGKWSAATRDMERDIIPMCISEGMGIVPWGALGGGYFKTDEQRKQNTGRKMPGGATPADIAVSRALEAVAARHGKNTRITSIALAYVRQKAPNVIPNVGGRSLEHLKANIEALSLRLSEEDIRDIEAAYPFDVGFPVNFLLASAQPKIPHGPEDVLMVNLTGHYEYLKPSTEYVESPVIS